MCVGIGRSAPRAQLSRQSRSRQQWNWPPRFRHRGSGRRSSGRRGAAAPAAAVPAAAVPATA
eukprot:6705679-Lingulodinium_polyedra.AAC.1